MMMNGLALPKKGLLVPKTTGPKIQNVFMQATANDVGSFGSISSLDLSTKAGFFIDWGDSGTVKSIRDTIGGAVATKTLTNITASPANDAVGQFQASNVILGAKTSNTQHRGLSFLRNANFCDFGSITIGTNTNRRISHILATTPGMIIVKDMTSFTQAYAYLPSYGRGRRVVFSGAAVPTTDTDAWGTANPTTTDFGIRETLYSSGGTLYWYAFAHDTSSAGLCANFSYTGNGSATGPVITLGWEPAFILINGDVPGGTTNMMFSTIMGGVTTTTSQIDTFTDMGTSTTDQSVADIILTSSTGFQMKDSFYSNNLGTSYHGFAIRKGPM